MKRILVAMSGGVDSAAAALLLRGAGYEICGGTMRLRPGAEREAEDAERVCRALGIGFRLYDFQADFERLVVEPFQRVYQQGGTPNPCVLCNRTVKFGLLLDRARAEGFDGIATGHYARIEAAGERRLLKTALETARDQSYFLYALSQEQLAHSLFPLGGRTKAEARSLAEAAGLPVARKQDSQDICFVPDGDYMAYLRARGMRPQEGSFLLHGLPVARHAGMEAYTIGQRRGLDFAAGRRVYVTGKRGADVLLGDDAELFSRTAQLAQTNWLAFDLPAEFEAECKLRSGPRRSRCRVRRTEGGAQLEFSEPQRAVTPGQSAVLYRGEYVLGGGIITGTEPGTYGSEDAT